MDTANLEIREYVNCGRLQEVKTNGKSLTVRHKKWSRSLIGGPKWSFTRGSSCKAFTGKILLFWIGGRLWEVIAYERWSHMEVRLYRSTIPKVK